jgi:hypothetical protein
MEINLRLTVDDKYGMDKGIDNLGVEEMVVHDAVASLTGVNSAVVLRNNGFGHLLPDESTRQEH